MKTRSEKRQPLVIALMIILSLVYAKSFSQEDVVEKISKVFSANKNSVLNIDTKYGDVDIRDWEKNEIKIDVEIIIRNLSSQKAKQVLDNIDIDIHEEGNTVYAETKLGDAFFKILGNKHHKDNNQFEINYVVHMPATVAVNLENKYGNVFINKLESKSTISVKYGNLQANQLLSSGKENMTEINLGYSNGTIEACKWLKLNIKYSKMTIQKSKALIILSKYSKVYIDKNSSVVCESKYDTYRIGTLSNFVTEAQYSNFKFDAVGNKFRCNTKYTDVKIAHVPASFELIEIENSYGSISIGIDPGASYRLKGHAKYAKIHYPSDSRVNKFQENTEMRVDGVVGSENGELPSVKIETRYGSINLVK